MERENKVGLFVGLCIIVLFMVIVAGLGGTGPRKGAPNFGSQVADSGSGRPSAPLNGKSADANEGRLPVERTLVRPTPPPITLADSRKPDPIGNVVDATPGHRDMPLPDAPSHIVNGPAPEVLGPGDHATNNGSIDLTQLASNEGSRRNFVVPPSIEADPAMKPEADSGQPSDGSLSESGMPPDSGQSNTLSSRVETTPPVDGTEKPTVDSDTSISPDATKPTDAKAERYRIREGDTFIGICKQHYGSASPRVMAVVFEANKSVLRDTSNIPANRELVMPAMAHLDKPDTKSASANNANKQTVRTREVNDKRIPKPLAEERVAKSEPAKKPRTDARSETAKSESRRTVASKDKSAKSRDNRSSKDEAKARLVSGRQSESVTKPAPKSAAKSANAKRERPSAGGKTVETSPKKSKKLAPLSRKGESTLAAKLTDRPGR